MGATAKEAPQENSKDIFDIVGSFGPWQRGVFILFFCINTVGIWQNFAITFLAPNMDFWCVQTRNVDNLSIFSADANSQSTYNGSVFLKGGKENQCEVEVYYTPNNTESGGISNESFVKTEPCTKWEYDTSYYSETIVSEWDLVCDNEWLISLAKSVYMVGFLVSVIFFGQLSDCIGRKPTIVIAYIVACVSLLLSLLSSSYLMFVVLRFFQAFGRTGLTTTGYVLIMEMIGSQHRTEVGIGIQIGWTFGFFLLPAVAYFFRHWFWFQLALSVPLLLIAFTYRLIPESPRWLLMQRKTENLEKLIRHAAEKNHRELKGDIKDLEIFKFPEQDDKSRKTKTIFDLLKIAKMRYRIFNMAFLWIVNSFVYYGLSFNTNDLGGNPYLNFFIAGVVELPSYLVMFYGIKYFGRRPVLVGLMLVGGAACAAIIPIPEGYTWLIITLSMLGKLCISGSFGLLYLYTTEMFPTVVRNVAIGSCSMCARIGSIVAPFVRELGKATHASVPNIVYAGLAVTSGLIALLLPETKGRKIPDSLEEGEHFGELESEEINEGNSKPKK